VPAPIPTPVGGLEDTIEVAEFCVGLIVVAASGFFGKESSLDPHCPLDLR
jgi:hypothetical protein